MRLAQLHGLLPWLPHERPPELPVELLCETSPPFGVVSALLRLARSSRSADLSRSWQLPGSNPCSRVEHSFCVASSDALR